MAPEQLQCFRLELRSLELGSRVVQSHQKVQLPCIARAPRVTGSHMAWLAQRLPRRLTSLELSFCLCGITSDARWQVWLQVLLDSKGLAAVVTCDEDGVAALAGSLPKRLSRLKLDLGSCAIGDSGVPRQHLLL